MEVRRKAVAGLAKVGSAEVWEVIAERALGATDPRVADEAQLQLGRASWTEALEGALDSKFALRSRTAFVRERAVEALGRIQGAVPVELFARGLKDKEERVRRATAFALEARLQQGADALDLSSDKELASLRKTLAKMAASDRDMPARANAIAALAALGRSDAEAAALFQGVVSRQDESPLVRAASLWALRESNTIEDLRAALADGDHGVGMMALRLLGARGDRDSALALCAALPGEASETGMRPALAWAIVASLRDASGLSHGLVRERWIRWAEGLGADWKRGSAPAKGKAMEGGAGSTTFYGLRLVSDRLVFLVDMSGSMWIEKGGVTRKAQAEVELAKALGGLTESTRFNLVPYANAPGPWEDGLVPATTRNVESAIDWFQRNTLRGQGDVWTPLMQALQDPEIDTVVILSDGAPSGGQRWNIELMRPLLQSENRFRGVVIHAVMFDAGKFRRQRWAEMVEDWGGVQHLID